MYYKVLSQSGAVTLTALLINFSGFLTLKIFEATFKETMLSRMFYLQI